MPQELESLLRVNQRNCFDLDIEPGQIVLNGRRLALAVRDSDDMEAVAATVVDPSTSYCGKLSDLLGDTLVSIRQYCANEKYREKSEPPVLTSSRA